LEPFGTIGKSPRRKEDQGDHSKAGVRKGVKGKTFSRITKLSWRAFLLDKTRHAERYASPLKKGKSKEKKGKRKKPILGTSKTY